jgi:hypothetical protein
VTRTLTRLVLAAFLAAFLLGAKPVKRNLYPKWESYADAVLCCDGDGDYTTCYRHGLDKSPNNPFFVCLMAHEADHVSYFRRHHPDLCVGRAAGAATFAVSRTTLRVTECHAYAVQAACILQLPAPLWQHARWLLSYAEETYQCKELKP